MVSLPDEYISATPFAHFRIVSSMRVELREESSCLQSRVPMPISRMTSGFPEMGL